MRKLICIVLLAAVCGGVLTSCNEKPKSYRFVKVMSDGKEQVEKITAQNDTDALRQYMKAMEKEIIANMENPGAKPPIKAMFVISPDGDTLNTDNELINAAMKGEEDVVTIVPATAEAPEQQATEPAK